MSKKIFVNLPVKDLEISKQFFTKLGFSFNEQFTDENAACLVISDDIYAMLLREDFFKRFTMKDIVDAKISTETMVALSAESRVEVDDLIKKAMEAGGKPGRKEDQGFMYGQSFEDLDGHIWELVYMDMNNLPQR